MKIEIKVTHIHTETGEEITEEVTIHPITAKPLLLPKMNNRQNIELMMQPIVDVANHVIISQARNEKDH